MRYSRNSVRQIAMLVLALASLLQTSVGPTDAQRQLGSRDQLHALHVVNPGAWGARTPSSDADPETRARLSEAYGKLPLRFEANTGQTDAQVKFLSRGNWHSLFLTPAEAVFVLRNGKAADQSEPQSVVRMKLVGANDNPQMEGLEALPGKSHYFIGNDPGRWRRNVTSYARVRYRSVYPGVDVVYYGNQQQLEYDFVVAPGADPYAIKLGFDGGKPMEVDSRGDLVLRAAGGEVRQHRPVVYQEANGHKQEIAGRYVLNGEREVSFELAAYDRTRPLVIDPVVTYSTFLGGSGGEFPFSIAADAAGNAYLTGETSSLDFPTVNPLDPTPGNGQSTGGGDVFVTKLDPAGSTLLYSTYLGGGNHEQGRGIAIDDHGNAYVTGITYSTDFPMSRPFQSSSSGAADAFLTKLNADGSSLVFSTYFGGSNVEIAWSVAVDTRGCVYITGNTSSTDFPTRNPLQPSYADGGFDVFVTKFNAEASALVYSTYLGGTGYENISDIAVDCDGQAYITGPTASRDFPTANPFQPVFGGGGGGLDLGTDAFVTKLDSSGTAFIYSTYLGGNSSDSGLSIAADDSGNAYVTGSTDSTNFPTANPWQPALSGHADVFVTKFNRNGSALIYSTYLGGVTSFESGYSIAVDSKGQAYIAGVTGSIDFPTINAVQPMPDDPIPGDFGGQVNAFVTKLNARGSALVYSTYLGGSSEDWGWGVAVDARDKAYVVGYTQSEDFPATPGAFQRELRGFRNAFIIKIDSRRHHPHGQSLDETDHQTEEDR
jgi:Beta-propeller repeat